MKFKNICSAIVNVLSLNATRKLLFNDMQIILLALYDLEPYIAKYGGLRVLDLGSGLRGPLGLMFAHLGAQVTCGDICFNNKSKGIMGLIKALFENYRTFIYSRMYKRFLPFKQKGSIRKIFLDCTDMHSIESNSYDLVVSKVMLEHVKNFDIALDEIKRILKPGGLAWITIHPITSLTGDHKFTPGCSLEPWGHLRGLHDAMRGLNWVRINQYEEEIEKKFKILLYHKQDNALYMQYLTDEIYRELSAEYTKEELSVAHLRYLLKKEDN